MYIIFDLDGTLSNHNHRLPHVLGEVKDYERYYDLCHLDEPHTQIVNLFHSLRKADYDLEIWTGRTDRVKEKTLPWLADIGIGPNYLTHMRREGDFTPDYALKGAWLQEAIEAGNKPDLAFEDRPRMVEFWRNNGVMCCDIGGF